MNWIECSPEEATRATINGRVLTKDGDVWRLDSKGQCVYWTAELFDLGATFEKEAPKMSKSEGVNMEAFGQPYLMCLDGVYAFIVNNTDRAVNVTVSARTL